MGKLKHGKKFNAESSRCQLREIFNQSNSNLDFLSASELRILNARSQELCYRNEESLVFNLKGPLTCQVGEKEYRLDHYDVLYIPLDTPFHFDHSGDEEALLYIYRATGNEKFEVFHTRWEDAQKNEKRIRHLNRKVVYKMFDVSENANKFMAGYTFYESYTRAWPPHNHTDQEEVYSFIEGRGAMTVYESDEEQTFVTSVETGDHVTIPVLNYHPVFSHDEPLCFIWCIAGERYWVGDKNTDFMKGEKGNITT